MRMDINDTEASQFDLLNDEQIIDTNVEFYETDENEDDDDVDSEILAHILLSELNELNIEHQEPNTEFVDSKLNEEHKSVEISSIDTQRVEENQRFVNNLNNETSTEQGEFATFSSNIEDEPTTIEKELDENLQLNEEHDLSNGNFVELEQLKNEFANLNSYVDDEPTVIEKVSFDSQFDQENESNNEDFDKQESKNRLIDVNNSQINGENNDKTFEDSQTDQENKSFEKKKNISFVIEFNNSEERPNDTNNSNLNSSRPRGGLFKETVATQTKRREKFVPKASSTDKHPKLWTSKNPQLLKEEPIRKQIQKKPNNNSNKKDNSTKKKSEVKKKSPIQRSLEKYPKLETKIYESSDKEDENEILNQVQVKYINSLEDLAKAQNMIDRLRFGSGTKGSKNSPQEINNSKNGTKTELEKMHQSVQVELLSTNNTSTISSTTQDVQTESSRPFDSSTQTTQTTQSNNDKKRSTKSSSTSSFTSSTTTQSHDDFETQNTVIENVPTQIDEKLKPIKNSSLIDDTENVNNPDFDNFQHHHHHHHGSFKCNVCDYNGSARNTFKLFKRFNHSSTNDDTSLNTSITKVSMFIDNNHNKQNGSTPQPPEKTYRSSLLVDPTPNQLNYQLNAQHHQQHVSSPPYSPHFEYTYPQPRNERLNQNNDFLPNKTFFNQNPDKIDDDLIYVVRTKFKINRKNGTK